ncbi:MAG: 2-amino-4-hydroxy-6-hydroxymethyldihydropteridine diphosphokinase [Neorhizobium sp.]|nr:2-amino-4-hydroxy-6-hydroxymethyldihydropteridine diphosphokinase [Neorhizobium sp.]
MSPEAGFQRAALGLGGNLGEPRHLMAQALKALDERDDCRVVSVSRLYKTPPWGKLDQADFFNACALVETCLDPVALLDLCLEIERGMKRVRTERWGPRTIDLDVLTYGQIVLDSERLTLPHPRMTERGFVMMPLTDIAPDLKIGGKPVEGWLKDVDVTGIEVADADPDWWR